MSEFELYEKTASDGSIVAVIPITFGRARVTIARHDPMFFDDVW
jgi:hypothetical protein